MVYLGCIFAYLLALVAIGIYKSRSIKTQEDFSVAGRSLGVWVLTGTLLATWIGTGSILGNAGKTYSSGIASFIVPLGGVLGILVLTKIAGKVRRFKKTTVPEILGERYGAAARVLSVVALLLAYMVIVSYQYNAGGAVLHTALMNNAGESLISLETATIIAVVFIIAYTMLAGLVSVAYTDAANGVLIVLTLLLATPFFWVTAGGWDGMNASFQAMGKPEHMQFFGVFSFVDVLNMTLPAFLLVLGDANMYQRFFAASSEKGASRATAFLVIGVLLVELLIIVAAWISSSLIPEAENGRHVLIFAARQFLPIGLGAIFLTTIVGIIVSTADSYLLVPATTLIKDVYLEYINPKANQKKIVLLSRIVVLALGLIAYVVSIGFAKSTTFFEKALYAYTIYGAAITPALFAAFFWKGATKQGAVASIVTGIVVTLLWKEAAFVADWVGHDMHSRFDEVLPAITLSVLALVGGSLLTRAPAKATT